MDMWMRMFSGPWDMWHWIMLWSILARLVATFAGIVIGIKKGPLTKPGFVQLAIPALFGALALPWFSPLFHSMSYVLFLQVVLPLLHYLIVYAAARRLIALRLSPQFCWVSLIPYATIVIVIVLSALQVQAKTPGQDNAGKDSAGPVQR
jgi:hypothetical protein